MLPIYLFIDTNARGASIVHAVEHIAGDIIISHDFFASEEKSGFVNALHEEYYINVEA
jgi:hypothetical protein